MSIPRLSQGNLKRDESDFIIECAVVHKETIVDLRLDRTLQANTARQDVWKTVSRQFEERFGKKISAINAKSNFKYRQKALKKDKEKCRILEQWLNDPSSISEEEVEGAVGKYDYLLFKMHPQGVLFDRGAEEWEQPFDTVVGVDESTCDHTVFPVMMGVMKEEETLEYPSHSLHLFPHNRTNEYRSETSARALPSSSFPDSIAHKRQRLDESQPIPRFAPPSSEKEYLELELLRAKIELTKSKQLAVDKEMQSSTKTIEVMERMMTRLEERKEEPDQSALMSIIAIMKDMVKK